MKTGKISQNIKKKNQFQSKIMSSKLKENLECMALMPLQPFNDTSFDFGTYRFGIYEDILLLWLPAEKNNSHIHYAYLQMYKKKETQIERHIRK